MHHTLTIPPPPPSRNALLARRRLVSIRLGVLKENMLKHGGKITVLISHNVLLSAQKNHW